MIHVIAQIELKSHTREQFLAEFHRIVPIVRDEAGCIEYGPTVDAGTDIDAQNHDPNRVMIIEKWETLDHLKAHLVAPHMLDYRPKVKDYVVNSTLHILEPA